MSMPPDPTALRTLETIESVQRQLRDAATRLADVSARALRVAAETDWRTDAASLFYADAEQWRRQVAALSDGVDDARDDVGRLRARVESRAWGCGL